MHDAEGGALRVGQGGGAADPSSNAPGITNTASMLLHPLPTDLEEHFGSLPSASPFLPLAQDSPRSLQAPRNAGIVGGVDSMLPMQLADPRLDNDLFGSIAEARSTSNSSGASASASAGAGAGDQLDSLAMLSAPTADDLLFCPNLELLEEASLSELAGDDSGLLMPPLNVDAQTAAHADAATSVGLDAAELSRIRKEAADAVQRAKRAMEDDIRAGKEDQARKKLESDAVAQAARRRFMKDDGGYHDFILGLSIHERNVAINEMQLDQNEKMELIRTVRRYKQRISKAKTRLKAKESAAEM